MLNDRERGDLLFLLKAAYAWFITAGILLIIVSLLIWKTSLDSSCIGYLSSLISFLAAVSAGFAAVRLKSGLIGSLAIVIFLLTCGFLIAGEKMTGAAMVSVASTTIAGGMLGSCVLAAVFPGKKRKTKRFKKA